MRGVSSADAQQPSTHTFVQPITPGFLALLEFWRYQGRDPEFSEFSESLNSENSRYQGHGANGQEAPNISEPAPSESDLQVLWTPDEIQRHLDGSEDSSGAPSEIPLPEGAVLDRLHDAMVDTRRTLILEDTWPFDSQTDRDVFYDAIQTDRDVFYDAIG